MPPWTVDIDDVVGIAQFRAPSPKCFHDVFDCECNDEIISFIGASALKVLLQKVKIPYDFGFCTQN